MKNAPHAQLIDLYGRRLSYLRISITERCDFKCVYCNPRLRFNKLHHGNILRFEEILQIVRIGISLGINKVRITGGEPLVRKGVYEFLSRPTQMDGLVDICS